MAEPTSSYTYCFCFKRIFRSSFVEPPKEIKAFFDRFSENGFMDIDHLLAFLLQVQKEDKATRDTAQNIIDGLRDFKHLTSVIQRKGLFLEAFFRYLFSDINSPLSSTEVHHDMSAPLSHYYIFTGHNSYLTGNQLSSDCSNVPIINALKRGVKVIELDMWPNPAGNNVDVLHGRTLTTPVELIKCLKSIKEYAFFASPYPVVITLEDHLTPDLRVKVAEMVTQTFGDMLFYPESEYLEEFPSPETLKRRIILSTKPPKEYLEAKSFSDKDNGLPKENDSTEEEAWGKEATDLKEATETHDKNDYGQSEQQVDEEDLDDGDQKQLWGAGIEYRRLIAISAGKKKAGTKESLTVDPNRVGRLSLSEQELEKASVSHGPDLIRFTQKNLLRIYPRGTRFFSSNYDPFVGWIHGAQMVAFNMQGYGKSLWLMQGFFRANGGCGYLKKPNFLLNQNQIFDPRAFLPVKKTLKVRVYMGDGWRLDFKKTHFDRYSPPDFYTRVGIAGVPADRLMHRTKIIEDDWTPVWDEEFVFPLTVPELALLRVEVHEYDMSEKDDFGGQTVLPISELKCGIRAVPLFDRKGVKFKSVKLLMRFEFI